MPNLNDFKIPVGTPFRFYKSMTTNERSWGIMLDKQATRFIPVLMLAFHKGVLDGIQAGLFSREDCGIYTTLLHNWKAFGMIPEYICVPMEQIIINSKSSSVAMPYVQLKQSNEIGTMIGRITLSLSDSMILSELLNTPVIISPESIEKITIELNNEEPVDEQIVKSIIAF